MAQTIFFENQIFLDDISSLVSTFKDWEFFRDQSVLVTGGAGLVPSYLVNTLLYANHVLSLNLNITCLVRSEQSNLFRLASWINNSSLHLIYGTAEEYPYSLLEPHSIIVHAASAASPKIYAQDPVGVILPNSTGTMRLCDQGRLWQIKRLLYFSTGEVYGINSKEYFNELDFGYLDPNSLRSCYAESKRVGESICKAYSHQYSLPATSARIFHTYGPQMLLDDGRVFADFVRDALNRKPIVLASSGSARRCFCYLKDATSAFLTLLVNGLSGEAYNLANPNAEISILELAHLVANLVDPKLEVSIQDSFAKKPGYVPSAVPRSLPSVLKLEALGWRASIGLEEGFSRTLLSYSNFHHA
ncbi:NAD-dependent epimerase/dehydratase family protein [Synechococcus sp. MVIR-18-1]|uniref:NAD-dependent epimerase/dehydratase family protein n=1 Tax=Synechococcus sp. MVIR-18-1 TaxID=1386941 RepID=UPI001647FA0F|nr:NAD-dependent epimerase/dehydratase family protein [Synechococcus sp. MVIR-18-1]